MQYTTIKQSKTINKADTKYTYKVWTKISSFIIEAIVYEKKYKMNTTMRSWILGIIIDQILVKRIFL